MTNNCTDSLSCRLSKTNYPIKYNLEVLPIQFKALYKVANLSSNRIWSSSIHWPIGLLLMIHKNKKSLSIVCKKYSKWVNSIAINWISRSKIGWVNTATEEACQWLIKQICSINKICKTCRCIKRWVHSTTLQVYQTQWSINSKFSSNIMTLVNMLGIVILTLPKTCLTRVTIQHKWTSKIFSNTRWWFRANIMHLNRKHTSSSVISTSSN